jgi:hypothetical protein
MREDGKTATVWFNGPSVRQFLDIPRQPLEIGCNFIEQHRNVDHVCAYDGPVIKALNDRLTDGVQYWTRRNFVSDRWQQVSAPIDHGEWRHHTGFCSGTLALALAVSLGSKTITLMGLDWLDTNESIYDSKYEWRKRQPTKHSNHKLNFLRTVSEIVHLQVIHSNPRQFGDRIEWIDPKCFLQSI